MQTGVIVVGRRTVRTAWLVEMVLSNGAVVGSRVMFGKIFGQVLFARPPDHMELTLTDAVTDVDSMALTSDFFLLIGWKALNSWLLLHQYRQDQNVRCPA